MHFTDAYTTNLKKINIGTSTDSLCSATTYADNMHSPATARYLLPAKPVAGRLLLWAHAGTDMDGYRMVSWTLACMVSKENKWVGS